MGTDYASVATTARLIGANSEFADSSNTYLLFYGSLSTGAKPTSAIANGTGSVFGFDEVRNGVLRFPVADAGRSEPHQRRIET